MNPINIPALAQRAHPLVQISDGQAITVSTEVSRVFEKRHDHVLDAIRSLLKELPADSLPNFRETEIARPSPLNGEPIKSPAYHLTRDGFTLLAMGFTGKRALAFKLAYIDAFNKMEAALANAAPAPQQIEMNLPESGLSAAVVSEIVASTTQNIVETLQKRRKLISWPEVIEALQNPQTDMQFSDLTSLTHACLNRLQRNINAEAYETIQRRAAKQGVSTADVSWNA